MKFQKLVTSALLVAGTASVLAVAPVSVNAATIPASAVKNKASLTKEGYVMRILNDKDATANTLAVPATNNALVTNF